jgi:hypothetical protein
VHDDPGRLVHHQQVVVLVCDPQREILGLKLGLDALRDLELELLPALEAVALRPLRSVHERRAFLDEPLGRRARADLRQRGEEAIEPLAYGFCGND